MKHFIITLFVLLTIGCTTDKETPEANAPPERAAVDQMVNDWIEYRIADRVKQGFAEDEEDALQGLLLNMRRRKDTFTRLIEDTITHFQKLKREPMAKKKKTTRKKASAKKWAIDVTVGANTQLTLDINGFMKDVDSKLVATLDPSTLKISPKSGGYQFSLSQCAAICDVEGPALNYYVKEGVVKPHGRPEAGTKKHFTYDALLTFWIICKLKTGMRINVDVIKTLQKQVQDAASSVKWA